MSQRVSGYERVGGDLYETPAWVTHALQPHLPGAHLIWEPACGTGAMVRALQLWPGVVVRASDITEGDDFLKVERCYQTDIVTNPPYGLQGQLAEVFIEHALELTRPVNGRVAMVLRTDFDHAKSRKHLFKDCPQFSKKVVLLSRVRWIPGSTGSPSFNHAWFIWSWQHTGAPTIAYHDDDAADGGAKKPFRQPRHDVLVRGKAA
jgi:hypothetical protein